jgi:hypothetical protein
MNEPEAIETMANWVVDKLCIQFGLTPQQAKVVLELAIQITQRGIKE